MSPGPADARDAALAALVIPPHRAIDPRWLNPRETVPGRYERTGPWPADHPIYARLRAQPASEAIFLTRADGKAGLSDNALTRRIRLRRADGRTRVVLALGALDLRKPYLDRPLPPIRPEVAAVIERRIVRHATRTDYRLRITGLDRLGISRARVDEQAALLAWWIHTLSGADRIGLADDPVGRPVVATIRVVADGPLAERLAALIAGTPGFGDPPPRGDAADDENNLAAMPA